MSDYTSKPREEYPEPAKRETVGLVTQRPQYRAVQQYKSGERVERFRLVDKNGNFAFYSYQHLLEGVYEDGLLTLSLTTRSYLIKGENLPALIALIEERKAKIIQEFNPDLHERETDPKAIYIELIEKVE